jgi:hypothetical protein
VHVEEIAKRIEHLLEQERAAIRALDGASLEESGREKAALVEALKALSPAELARGADSLKRLSGSLRRNAILLAHARDALRDVLHAARGSTSDVPGRRSLTSSVAPGAHLSRTV